MSPAVTHRLEGVKGGGGNLNLGLLISRRHFPVVVKILSESNIGPEEASHNGANSSTQLKHTAA